MRGWRHMDEYGYAAFRRIERPPYDSGPERDFRTLCSARDAIRTHDTRFRRAVLYPLSYPGNGCPLYTRECRWEHCVGCRGGARSDARRPRSAASVPSVLKFPVCPMTVLCHSYAGESRHGSHVLRGRRRLRPLNVMRIMPRGEVNDGHLPTPVANDRPIGRCVR